MPSYVLPKEEEEENPSPLSDDEETEAPPTEEAEEDDDDDPTIKNEENEEEEEVPPPPPHNVSEENNDYPSSLLKEEEEILKEEEAENNMNADAVDVSEEMNDAVSPKEEEEEDITTTTADASTTTTPKDDNNNDNNNTDDPSPTNNNDTTNDNDEENNNNSGGEAKTYLFNPLFKDPSPALKARYEAQKRATAEERIARTALNEARQRLRDAEDRHAAAAAKVDKTMNAVFQAELKESCPWNTMFLKLLDYKKEHGDVDVPRTAACGDDVEMRKLSRWVLQQRKKYQKDKMKDTPHRAASLTMLGLDWGKNQYCTWETRYKQLVKYREEHGHCDVPLKSSRGRVVGLSGWVSTQRQEYWHFKEGTKKKPQMTDEKIKKLEAIGFRWTVLATRKRPWDELYQDLLEFRVNHGHTVVPQKFPENPGLAVWVRNQRTCYRLLMDGKKSPLTEERIRLLEEVDFCWRLHAKKGEGKKKKKPKKQQQKQQQEEDNNNNNVEEVEKTAEELELEQQQREAEAEAAAAAAAAEAEAAMDAMDPEEAEAYTYAEIAEAEGEVNPSEVVPEEEEYDPTAEEEVEVEVVEDDDVAAVAAGGGDDYANVVVSNDQYAAMNNNPGATAGEVEEVVEEEMVEQEEAEEMEVEDANQYQLGVGVGGQQQQQLLNNTRQRLQQLLPQTAHEQRLCDLVRAAYREGDDRRVAAAQAAQVQAQAQAYAAAYQEAEAEQQAAQMVRNQYGAAAAAAAHYDTRGY